MSFANKAMLAFWVGGVLGLLSTGIVWHPDEHSTYTGFPVPIGVEVMLLFELPHAAQRLWRKLNGHQRLADAILGVRFIDGIKEMAA